MLIVRLLGGLAVDLDGSGLTAPRGRCGGLLAWLALHPGMQPRARVAARLWPDVMDESARRSLRTALLALRPALGPEAAEHLIGTRDEIGLGPDVRVDVRNFRAAPRPRVPRCRRAHLLVAHRVRVALYRAWALRDAGRQSTWDPPWARPRRRRVPGWPGRRT